MLTFLVVPRASDRISFPLESATVAPRIGPERAPAASTLTESLAPLYARCTTPKEPLQGAMAVHFPRLPPVAPAGLFPAVTAHSRVKLVGPVLAGTVTAAEVQVPFGPPAGQETATLLSVSEAGEQVS